MLVGLAGLEPATFRPPDGRATRLRHSPTIASSYLFLGQGQEVIAIFRSATSRRFHAAGHARLKTGQPVSNISNARFILWLELAVKRRQLAKRGGWRGLGI